jgi:hypothetical protein
MDGQDDRQACVLKGERKITLAGSEDCTVRGDQSRNLRDGGLREDAGVILLGYWKNFTFAHESGEVLALPFLQIRNENRRNQPNTQGFECALREESLTIGPFNRKRMELGQNCASDAQVETE